jgi:dTDP-4-amino-4,6-dideoxygalactose transaminase
MPSFTSVSTALGIARSGATPVFADIDPETLNLAPAAAASAVTARTRALVPVHYAGVACDMEALGEIARRNGLALVEDAAQAVASTWRGTPLGAIGDLGCLSFHGTKNVSCGEGGALIVRDSGLIEAAEVLRNKGTNRTDFLAGRVGEYTWVDRGGSYLLSELNAAFLWGQLEALDEITARRLELWNAYYHLLEALERAGSLRRPVVPAESGHNAHAFPVLLDDRAHRDRVIGALDDRGIQASFHFVPLHSSPAGRRFGRTRGDMTTTDDVAGRLLRLPLWVGMGVAGVERVVEALTGTLA